MNPNDMVDIFNSGIILLRTVEISCQLGTIANRWGDEVLNKITSFIQKFDYLFPDDLTVSSLNATGMPTEDFYQLCDEEENLLEAVRA